MKQPASPEGRVLKTRRQGVADGKADEEDAHPASIAPQAALELLKWPLTAALVRHDRAAFRPGRVELQTLNHGPRYQQPLAEQVASPQVEPCMVEAQQVPLRFPPVRDLDSLDVDLA